MKILLHGAINGSNFGDCLFAHIFYEEFSKFGIVDFLKIPVFGMGEFLKKEITSYKPRIDNFREADCLVYISGGYFGDTNGNLKESIFRYYRYFRIAEYFIRSKKPIYICGVGGGPLRNLFLRKKIVRILNYAKFISVRDNETAKYFKDIGVNNRVLVTTDTALTILNKNLPAIQEYNQDFLDSKKNIFLHVYGDDFNNLELTQKIVPALNNFLAEHNNEYRVFVGTDNLTKNKICDLEVYKKIIGDKVPVTYKGTWNFCSFLNQMNSVITVKLHVGIVSSLFGKSVISFPKHIYKTKRFYEQINYPERCKLLKNCKTNDIYEILCKYIDKPVNINLDLIQESYVNLEPFMTEDN